MKEIADVDLISSLPDEILFHIIASLPFESAIQTIFLSPRWRLLWNKSVVQHGTEQDLANSISGFVTNFNEQIPTRNNRKLQFHFGEGGVLSAIIAPGNKLHLDFSTGKQEFSRQFGWKLVMNNQSLTHQPSLSNFLVKTLYLKSVSFLTNEAVSSVISNFQFLENLNIIECNGLQSLSIESNSKLQNLTILDCPQFKFLHIRSFKLQTFRFRGLFPRLWPEYHFNLADAMLDSRQGPGYNSFQSIDFDPVLLIIKNVKILTLCRWTFEDLICPSLSSISTAFKFYRLKELWWIDNQKEGIYNSDALISFLKLCPSLERLFITIDPKGYSMASTATYFKQAGGGHTELRHLKVVKLEGFSNQEDEILLAQRLSEVFNVEPLILATSDGICLRNLVKVHSNQPKQQSWENLEIVEPQSQQGKCPNKLVEQVKEVKELCPKHAHMGL